MCKYCEKRQEIRSTNFGGAGRIRVYEKNRISAGLGFLEVKGDSAKVKIFRTLYCPRFDIKYCPMCGRNLEVK